MGMHKSMIIDKETDIFLKNRIKSNSKLHHLLNPVELRTERLRQLREDNLTPPKIYNSENLKIKNRFNKDVKLRFYFPYNFNKKTKIPTIVFFHGGGFVMGDLDTHDFTCRSICLESQMIVVAVDYSLSPEHKFPYAVEEVKDVLNSLVNFEKDFFIDLENIFVCGDSAGGNLATVLSINSRDKKVIPIRGQILVYPCVDLTLTMRSMDIFLEGMTLTFDTMDYFVKHYLNSSNDAVNWEASPLFAKDLYNLPETFIGVLIGSRISDKYRDNIQVLDIYLKIKQITQLKNKILRNK